MRKFQLPEGVFKVLRAVAQDKRFIAATEIAYEAVSKRVPLWRVNRDGISVGDLTLSKGQWVIVDGCLVDAGAGFVLCTGAIQRNWIVPFWQYGHKHVYDPAVESTADIARRVKEQARNDLIAKESPFYTTGGYPDGKGVSPHFRYDKYEALVYADGESPLAYVREGASDAEIDAFYRAVDDAQADVVPGTEDMTPYALPDREPWPQTLKSAWSLVEECGYEWVYDEDMKLTIRFIGPLEP